MTEKVTMGIVAISVIAMVWYGTNPKSNTSSKPEVSEENAPILPEEIPMEYIDEQFPESTEAENVNFQTDFSAINACVLGNMDTDLLSFSEAFGYYRQCLGADSSFQWQGADYTTVLIEEVIIQVADSVKVDSNNKENDISETR